MIKLIVLTIALTLSSCGKDKLSNSSNVDSSRSPSAVTSGCKSVSNSGIYSGCCSHHGGARNCDNPNIFAFTVIDELVCNDGTVSPTCRRN